MYETFNSKRGIPNHEDLELLSKLDDKGKYLLEDLYKIFSFKKPKTYKLYVQKINYTPSEEEKIIIDLILIIKKYNEALSKKKASYHLKNEENKYFAEGYKGFKLFNKELFGKEEDSSKNLLEEIINKYEKKHMVFNQKFLNSNIFNRCGLLPTTKKQAIDFFESEIQINGQNNYKSIKSIRFIEKLYEQIERISKKLTLNQAKNSFMNLENKKKEKKSEYLYKLNKYKIQKKEIDNDKEEIKILKELLDIANINYQRIIEELNIKNSKDKKKKLVKIKSKNKKHKNSEIIDSKSISIIQNIENENKNKENEDIFNNSQYKENKNIKKNFVKLKTINVSDRYYKTSSLEKFNGLNLVNNKTTSTGFNNTTKNNTFYDIQRNTNNLNNINRSYRSIKSKINLSSNQLKAFSHNNMTNSFSNISNNNINENNINYYMNKTSSKMSFHFNKLIKNKNSNINSNSQPNIINNFLTPKINGTNSLDNQFDKTLKYKNFNFYKKKSNLKKIKVVSKEPKIDKFELYLIRRKNVPEIYEELKNLKNVLNISKKNNIQKLKINQLFMKLYNKNRIESLNKDNAPKELFNSYCNMKESIEKCHGPERLYRKYKNKLNLNMKNKIVISLDQDKELKNKYYEFMKMIIKKKINENENNSL